MAIKVRKNSRCKKPLSTYKQESEKAKEIYMNEKITQTMDKDGLQKCLLLIQCNVRREYVTAIRLKDMIKEIILKHHYIIG